MIRIITIEREYGSAATAIAEKVATRLGRKLWDELLTEEIARLAHCESSAVQKREERRILSIIACSNLSRLEATRAAEARLSKCLTLTAW